MNNQVVIDSLPFHVKSAQKVVLRTYQRLVMEQAPKDFKLAVKHLGENPLYSIILAGEDNLAKSALLSGINAYVILGGRLDTSKFSRMNISVPLAVLEKTAGFPADVCAQARAAGHKQLIIKAKSS